MRSVTDAMMSFLLSKQPFFSADLFTFTLADSTVIRVTSFDRDVAYGLDAERKVWSSVGPVVSRSTWSVKNTLEVPSLEVNIWSTGTDGFGDQNFKAEVQQGLFEGATVLLQRAIMPTPGDTSLGLVTLFGGRTGPIDVTPLGVKITFRGHNVLLHQYMPKNRFEQQCIYSVYDAGCGVSKAAFTWPWVVGPIILPTYISWGGPGEVPSYPTNFTQGTVVFTSGPAEGQKRTISQATMDGFSMSYPLYELPVIGDSISITYGCDRTRDGARGCAFFANEQKYRGFLYVPPVETGL